MSKPISHNIILISVAATITAHEVIVPHVIDINHLGESNSFLFLTGSVGFINTLCVSKSTKEIEDEIFYEMQICFSS